MIKKTFLVLGILWMTITGSSQSVFEVRAKNLIVRVNSMGEIESIFDRKTSVERKFKAFTALSDCEPEGKVTSRRLNDGGIEFIKTFVIANDTNKSCSVTERFRPTENSVSWQLIIKGTGAPWSTGIQTVLVFEKPASSLFWTTWGDPNQLEPDINSTRWSDPLRYMPFRDMHLIYGGHFRSGGGYSLPVISIAESKNKSGISLIMSPDDIVFDMHLETSSGGIIKQTRFHNRISRENTIVFNMDLISHSDDWRAPLNWMVWNFEEYFNPVSTRSGEISGCGAYSAADTPVDAGLYKKMGGIVNWSSSFDFPYMGMFIPPVSTDATSWTKYSSGSSGEYDPSRNGQTSISKMRASYSYMRKNGFYTLNYFNITEFGGGSAYSDSMIFPGPSVFPLSSNNWTNPNYYFYKNFPDALLYGSMGYSGWSDSIAEQLMHPKPMQYGKPFYTWGGAFATDCGEASYQKFLLRQAMSHIEKFPDASGICIDRLDWLNEYNWKADDKISWVGNHSVRSLITSWKGFLPALADLFHRKNKVIYCNPLINRLDLMRFIDGVYNEYGQYGHQLNLSAFLTLRKTFMAWTPDSSVVMKNPDDYFQRHLYMGAFPTAPFPANDHCITPDSVTIEKYLMYGPLFDLLHGKEWILTPGIIHSVSDSALVNIFRTEDYVIIPIVFSRKKEGIVRVEINKTGEIAFWQRIKAVAVLPGNNGLSDVKISSAKDSFIFEVPVHKGCAMLRIHH